MHDARILRNSTLYLRAEQGKILTGLVIDVNGHEIGPYLFGGSAYPISEIHFNHELSSARVKIECAFGCLK